jgi:hypothetical protein
VGPLELHYEKLLVPDARDQQLVVLSAEPGSPSAEALTLLRVLQEPGRKGSEGGAARERAFRSAATRTPWLG